MSRWARNVAVRLAVVAGLVTIVAAASCGTQEDDEFRLFDPPAAPSCEVAAPDTPCVFYP